MANIYTDIKLFDAEYYLANNADVAAAIEGTDVTAQDHYFLHGAAENRAPNSWFNAAEYVAQNPDLADVDANLLLAHFALHGVNEGRAPNAATAGADGKIKPELLADYVNAEGNEDVKAAIAEITGTPVGAELTAEQATIAAQHFFTYGINEGRKGGIADEISGDDTGIEAVVEALEAYQAALTAQEAAVKAEKEVIKSAAERDDVTLATDADAETAKTAVDTAVDIAKGKVGTAANGTITGDVSDTKIANAEKVLQAKVDAAKAAVAEEAANAPVVVALQQQLLAQADAVKAANVVVTNYEGEEAKFGILNNQATVGLTAAKPAVSAVPGPAKEAEPFFATVNIPEDTTVTPNIAEKDFVITVVNGKTVVYSGKATDIQSWKNGVPAKDADGNELLEKATDKDLKDVKGLDALVATIVAVEGNQATIDKANAAVEAAVVKALKAEGYKLYKVGTKDEVSTDWAKALEDGTLASGFAIAKGLKGDKVDPDTELDTTNPFYNPAELDGDFKASVTENKLDLTGTAFAAPATATGKAAVNSEAAVSTLDTVETELKDFQEAVETYNELKAIQTELADAAKAVEAAGEAVEAAAAAFEDLGVNLVTDVTTDGTVNDEDDEDQPIDLFVYSGEQLDGVANFDGDDLFYFGDAAVALVVADKANLAAGKQLGGQADVLEIFAVQDGANTVLYVEKEAFAGNSSNLVDENNEDFVKIELVGVNAEDLQFNDGFLMFA